METGRFALSSFAIFCFHRGFGFMWAKCILEDLFNTLVF